MSLGTAAGPRRKSKQTIEGIDGGRKNRLWRFDMDKNCTTCEHAKDKWHNSCYCTYYGYIRSKPKQDCWGYKEREETSEKDDKKEE